MWLAPTLQYLPVRIVIRQDADTFVDLLLSSLRGIAIVRLFDPADPAAKPQLRELARLIELRCGETSPPPARRTPR